MRHTNYSVKYLNIQLQAPAEKVMENCYIMFHGPMIAFYRDEENPDSLVQGDIRSILLHLFPMTQIFSVEEVQSARISPFTTS